VVRRNTRRVGLDGLDGESSRIEPPFACSNHLLYSDCFSQPSSKKRPPSVVTGLTQDVSHAGPTASELVRQPQLGKANQPQTVPFHASLGVHRLTFVDENGTSYDHEQ